MVRQHLHFLSWPRKVISPFLSGSPNWATENGYRENADPLAVGEPIQHTHRASKQNIFFRFPQVMPKCGFSDLAEMPDSCNWGEVWQHLVTPSKIYKDDGSTLSFPRISFASLFDPFLLLGSPLGQKSSFLLGS